MRMNAAKIARSARELVEWLCEDKQAMQLVGLGISVMGARIVGELNLDVVQPPFGISFIKCAIPGRISLVGTHLRWLTLSGSHTGRIYAPTIVSDLSILLDGVKSSGELYMDGARIDGFLLMSGAHFRHESIPIPGLAGLEPWKLAVRIAYANIRGAVDMTGGFEADGGVELDNTNVSGDLALHGARII